MARLTHRTPKDDARLCHGRRDHLWIFTLFQIAKPIDVWYVLSFHAIAAVSLPRRPIHPQPVYLAVSDLDRALEFAFLRRLRSKSIEIDLHRRKSGSTRLSWETKKDATSVWKCDARLAVTRHPVDASLSILLSSRGTQARETVAVDRTLPDEQFIVREHVAAAGVLKRERTTAHGSYHLGRATDNPRLVSGGGRSAIANGLPPGPICLRKYCWRAPSAPGTAVWTRRIAMRRARSVPRHPKPCSS
jgi:hypothetical protein